MSNGTGPELSLCVLFVSGDLQAFAVLKDVVRTTPHRLKRCATAEAALLELQQNAYDVVFLPTQAADGHANLIREIRAMSPWPHIIAMHEQPSVHLVVAAMADGARDFLPGPLNSAEARRVIEAAAASNRFARVDKRSSASMSDDSTIDLSSTSATMRGVLETARLAADGNAPMLLCGEAGTGKRTLCRAIHGWGARAQRPLGVGHCRAPSRAYLEAEWFGAIGSSAGATTEKSGRVAFCDGGTLLVEDIDQLPMATQCKLLRLIQHQEYEVIGDFTARAADVRVLATTSVDLETRVAEERFHPELYRALGAMKLILPPLRHRPQDTLYIAERYLAHYACQTRRNVVGFTHGAADALMRHSWPGNLRELRGLVESAVLVARNERVDTCDFPANGLNRVNAARLGDPVPLDRIEELHIRGVLSAAPSMEAAATTLGIDVVTLWRRRKRYGL